MTQISRERSVRRRLLIGAFAVGLLIVPACGGDDDGIDVDVSTPDMAPGDMAPGDSTDDSENSLSVPDSVTDVAPGTVSNDNSSTP